MAKNRKRNIGVIDCASGDGKTLTLRQRGNKVELVTRTVAGCVLVVQMTPEIALILARNTLVQAELAAAEPS